MSSWQYLQIHFWLFSTMAFLSLVLMPMQPGWNQSLHLPSHWNISDPSQYFSQMQYLLLLSGSSGHGPLQETKSAKGKFRNLLWNDSASELHRLVLGQLLLDSKRKSWINAGEPRAKRNILTGQSKLPRNSELISKLGEEEEPYFVRQEISMS